MVFSFKAFWALKRYLPRLKMDLNDVNPYNPYMTVKRAVQVLNVSNPTARKAVFQLEQDGILREITGRDWGKFYLASVISEAIQFPA
jgi:Fic family protein